MPLAYPASSLPGTKLRFLEYDGGDERSILAAKTRQDARTARGTVLEASKIEEKPSSEAKMVQRLTWARFWIVLLLFFGPVLVGLSVDL